MAVQGRYINDTDVVNLLSATIVRQIWDDNGNGTADDEPLERYIKAAESEVESFLVPVYSITDLRAAGQARSSEVLIDLCLAAVDYRACRRHPQYVRGDWEEKRKALREDLTEIRESKRSLDLATAPEPAANVGGYYSSGDNEEKEIVKHFNGPKRFGVF